MITKSRLIIVLSMLSLVVHAEPFSDDLESGLGAWNGTGSWGLSSLSSVSPTQCVADSPAGYYTNGTDASLTLGSALDLSSAIRPALGFWHRYELEQGWDFATVEISTNGGFDWSVLSGGYTGTKPAWDREQFDLASVAGASNVLVRFRIRTDSSVVMDGWFIDNIRIGERPASATLYPPAEITANGMALCWTASSDPGFAAYRLYRVTGTNLDWHTARLVAEIASAAVTNFTDNTLCPKSRYAYRLMVLATNGLHNLSDEVSAQTAAGMDFPFLDNGEAGGGIWVADPPWALSSESSASPTNAWTDSPGAPYSTNLASCALTLAAPVNLAGVATPVLVFKHRYAFEINDYGNVEYSTNSGSGWAVLTNFSGRTVDEWKTVRVHLAACSNSSQVLVRFRITTDASGVTNGWSLDDISVSAAPAMVAAPVLSDINPHSIRLTWTAATETAFSHYAIYRATNSNVGLESTFVVALSDRSVTSVVDTALASDVTYYYRVYAVNPVGGISLDSPSASSARTTVQTIPFSDSFTSNLVAWTVTGTWGIETGFLSDSPAGANYTNNSTSEALTTVNLTGSVWPVLKFWDRYHLAAGDMGFVEVSPDGGTWTRLYGILNGAETNWTQRALDLSPWRNASNLRIRFILYTDGATVDDGWQVDDAGVEDRGEVTQGLPFYDGFEGGLSNWFGGADVWLGVSGTNAPYAGMNAAQDIKANLPQNTEYEVQLEKSLNLAGTVSPQLTFWAKWEVGGRSSYNVSVSVNQGLTWTPLWSVDGWGGMVSDWQRVQISLKDYRQPSVRIRWQVYSYNGTIPALNWSLDKVSVQDEPGPPVLTATIPDLTTINIQWAPTALGGAFQRYEVYRSSDGTVDINDLRIAQPSAESVTNFVDTGLVRGATYYYAVYMVDQNDTYVRSAGVLSGTTRAIAWSNFTESATNLEQWDSVGSWGVETNGGVTCLSDSPGGVYGNNSNSWINTSIRMTGVNWPLLHFREHYRLAQGDWGWVEVSSDGGGWTAVYGIGMGVTSNWTERVIDLSEWKNQANLRVRFRLQTDGVGVEDGWQLDDIWLEENTAVLSAPFFDNLERGLNRWLEGTSTWMTSVTNLSPVVGTNAAGDTVYQLAPNSRYVMELKGSLDLSQMLDPQLTFWARWDVGGRSWLGAQLSTDGGLTWGTPWAVDGYSGAVSDWTRIQVSIAGYRQPGVRFRFLVYSYNGTAPTLNFGFDNVGIGDRAPGPPTLILPENLGNSALLRPFLVVSNAVDAQNDPLTYRFEVFDTADLTNVIAQVPIVSGGLDTTSWEINPDLANQRQYWWRCRAFDGVYTGAWSTVSSFYVNQTFNPPAAVVIAGPPPGAIVGRSTLLTWFPASDVDAGDSVYRYHVQIDNTNTFASPEVNDATIPSPGVVTSADWTLSRELGSLSGNGNLVTNTVYYWRIRSQDTRTEFSAWSSGVWWFIFGTPPPTVGHFSLTSGILSFNWARTDKPMYIYAADDLRQTVWDQVSGPLYGTNAVLSAETNAPSRFYKLSTE